MTKSLNHKPWGPSLMLRLTHNRIFLSFFPSMTGFLLLILSLMLLPQRLSLLVLRGWAFVIANQCSRLPMPREGL